MVYPCFLEIKMKKLLSILFLALTLNACTWVKLTPEGEKVRVATIDEVKSCERKGKTNASLKADWPSSIQSSSSAFSRCCVRR